MSTDHIFDHAIQIGMSNRETKELCQNWCANLRIERSPLLGVGVIEARTGLPVSGGYLACEFADEPSMHGMDLKELAVDFVEQHCTDCTNRKPVRFPHIGQELDRRAQIRQTELERSAAEANSILAAAKSRSDGRRALKNGASSETLAVLDILDELDSQPEADDERLLSIANARPEVFTDSIIEAVIEFGLTEGTRAALALPVLVELDVSSRQTASIALLASEHLDGQIRAQHLLAVARNMELTAEQIRAATEALVFLAAPPGWHGTPKDGSPEPLIELYRLHPEPVKIQIRVLLQEQPPTCSVAACALAFLARDNSDLVKWAPPEMARAWRLSSSRGGFSRSGDSVNDALGDILAHHPDDADMAITHVRERSSSDLSVDWLAAYRSALHKARFDPFVSADANLQKVVANRALTELEAVDGSSSPDALQTLTELIRWLREEDSEVLAGERLRMLAISLRLSMMAASPAEYSTLVEGPLQKLEWDNLQRSLEYLTSELLRATVVGTSQEGVLALWELTETLLAASENDRELTIKGIRALGEVCGNPEARSPLLHACYTSMAHASQAVRSVGAELYGGLVAKMRSGIPPLLHELALLQLSDSYVIVHQYAILSLRWSRLPEGLRQRAAILVLNLAAIYSRSKDTARSDFIGSLCTLLPKAVNQLHGDAAKVVPVLSVQLASKINSPYDRLRLLRSLYGVSHDVEEYWTEWARLLEGDYPTKHLWEDWLATAWIAPTAHLKTMAEAAYEAATRTVPSGPGPVWEVTALLSLAGKWLLARDLLDRLSDSLPEFSWTDDRRRVVQGRRRALMLEYAIEQDQDDRIEELITEQKNAADDQELERLRAQGLMALIEIAQGDGAGANLEGLISKVKNIAQRIAPDRVARSWMAFAEALVAIDLLERARTAVLNAEGDSHRFLRAARIRVTEAITGIELARDRWQEFAESVSKAKDVGGGAQAAWQLIQVTLPVANHVREVAPQTAVEESRAVKPAPPMAAEATRRVHVAMANWLLNGEAPDWSQQLTLATGTLYDLGVQVTLTGAPDDAVALRLVPRTVEVPGVIDAPEFELLLPDTSARGRPIELTGTGRLACHVGTSLGARPIQIAYEAFFDLRPGPDLRAPVIVCEATRDGRQSATGYPECDRRLRELRDWLRRELVPPAGEQHTRDFLLLSSRLMAYAGACLQSHTFKKAIGEAEFQRQVLLHLRSAEGLGTEVLEAPKTAGGITDITFRGIPVELKVTAKKSFSIADAKDFADQDLQYAVGNNSRFGAVVVLDVAAKAEPPGGLGSDIRWMTRPDKPSRAVLLLVIRGCLPAPSSHSA